MNTIGKILVILNFLFAIAVGVFLVLDVAARTNWKNAYLDLKREADVMHKTWGGTAKAIEKVANDYKTVLLELEQIKQDLKDKEEAMAAMENSYKIAVMELENKLTDKDIVVKETLLAKQRLADEVTVLNSTIKSRESQIVQLEAEMKTILVQTRNYEQIAKARQTQNENLLEQNRELTLALARLKAGVNPDVDVIRNPNEPNPPAVVVNGKIERVDDTDSSLVQISIGTDHGVNKNHTLDVYRTQPEAKYLGMIRIVEAYHQKSVARFVHTGNAAFRPQLRKDDQVTSKITR